MVHLFDLMIGDYNISQGFGDRSDVYSWIKDINGNPIKGHNGVDVATPTGISLLNPFPVEDLVVVTAVGFEPNGYGNYIRMWSKTQNCVVLYGHCQTVLVKVGDILYFQQEVAKSDNTGWSSGPHCHVGFYIVDPQGNKLNRSNGFDGFLDILDDKVTGFTRLDPKVPGKPPTPISQPATITIPIVVNEKLVTNSDNYQRVIDYLNINKRADDTSSQTIIEAINALVDSNSELRAQLENERKGRATDQAVNLQEIANKDEQVKRLQLQLMVEEDKRANELKNIPTFDDLKKTYDKQYYELYAKYEDAMKAKGIVLNELAGVKNDVVAAVKTSLVQKAISSILHIFSV